MIINASTPPKGTVRSWLDHRAENDGIAFTFPDGEADLTWRELRDKAKLIAQGLVAKDISKSESIAIVYPNCRDGVLAIYGVLYGGFRATMINLVAGNDAISYALDHSEARMAFVHPSAIDLFDQANESSIERSELPLNSEHAEIYDLQPEDDALLMYTSGTTGRPKGVIHSHASLLAGGWTTAVAHELGPQDRGFCVLPVYHINGLCVTIMGALVSGGSISMCARFSASRFWQNAERSKVTWFSIVPTIVSHLLHAESEPSGLTRDRIRFGRSASSPLAPDVQSAFEKRFGIPIVETMGLTETAAQILSNPLPPAVRKIGSPGIAFGNDVAVFDSDFKPCDVNVEGEIVIRGPNVMKEYLKNRAATRESFAGDWLRTGDLGRMDEDGYVFVTGRLKELIIKGGENIAPREIDEALYSHPDVVEAAAFSVKCDRYGETVEAAVKLTDGSQVVEGILQDICQEKLGDFKRPDRVHILPELPKGPSGKIQRAKIISML
ncbi:MAG: AMP-binding protein [Rhizobiaceae bacterium]|nr:AMP-binding protein [Rhizobiaceae bacterium]